MKREFFKYAGVARDRKNVIKVRFTNNLKKRLTLMKRKNFTEVKFIELPDSLYKDEAIEYLMKCAEFNEYRNLLVDTLLKYE